MDLLGRDAALHIAQSLDARSVLALGACSREWRVLTQDEGLWQQLCRRDQPTLAAQHADAVLGGASWQQAYIRAHRLQALRRVAWREEDAAGRCPHDREGHAACSWGRRSMLLHGGFGGGIVADLHLLTPVLGPDAGSSGSAASGSGTGAGSASSGGGDAGYRWVQPRVSGTRPASRYGHTLTRCGRHGEMAVLFGGLMAGGYQAPLDTLAVLRRRPPAEQRGGAGEEERERREDDTSLGMRGHLGGLTGSAALQQMLLAGLLMFEDEDEAMGSDSDEDSSGDEDGPLLRHDGWTDTGSSEDGEGDESMDESSEEECMPEAQHATASPAGDARPSAPGSPPAAAVVAAAAAAAPAAATPTPPCRAPAPRVTDGSQWAQGWAAAEAQRVAAAGGRELGDGDDELEWFYPEVKGTPPGPRGYHSAAASPDGCKIYFFGGMGPGGSCATTAVLDVETWTFSLLDTGGQGQGPPCPRLGHSSCVYGGRLWVVGGGTGRDLLRTGRDLGDVHCLDLDTLEWRRLALPPGPLCVGKCHSAVQVGPRLLFFGGAMPTCADLAWLDLDTCAWGAPAEVLGDSPDERLSATAVLAGEEVLVFGGYSLHAREVGDLHRLRLLPEVGERRHTGRLGCVARRARAQRRGWW